MDGATKVCSKCGERKALAAFTPRKDSKDGRCGACRECRRVGHEAWRDANRDHVRESARRTAKALYARDPERFRSLARAWTAKNPDASAAKSRAWRDRNPDRVSEIGRMYRAARPDVVAARLAEWRAKNPDAGRRQREKERGALADAYVRRVLVESGFQRDQITPGIMQLKRERIAIQRLSKQLKSQLKEESK